MVSMTDALVIASNLVVALSSIGLSYVTFKDCAKDQQDVIKTLARGLVSVSRIRRRAPRQVAPAVPPGRHEAPVEAE